MQQLGVHIIKLSFPLETAKFQFNDVLGLTRYSISRYNNINDSITVDELQQLRCQARLLVTSFSAIRYGKKSLSYLSPVLWNTLDNDIKLTKP